MPKLSKEERNALNKQKRREFGESYKGEKEYQRAWYHKNKQRIKTSEWYEHNRAYHRAYYKNKDLNARKSHLKRSYGLTIEQYDEMLAIQNNTCFLCKQPERKIKKDGSLRNLSIDHNHITGELRKLLCHECNLLIGYYESAKARLGCPLDLEGYLI